MEKKLSIITIQGAAARPPASFARKLMAEGKAHYTSKSKFRQLLKFQKKANIRRQLKTEFDQRMEAQITKLKAES